MKKDLQTRRLINAMAFIALVFAAIALLFAYFFGDNGSIFAQIIRIIRQIAYGFAFIVAGIYAFYYVRSKSIVYTVIYIIACIVVAIFLVLPMFGI